MSVNTTHQNSITTKAAPLLPADSLKDNPLFIVLAILAFLATLTLLSVKASYQASGHWSARLNETATVQIKPVNNTDKDNMVQKAKDILLQSTSVENVEIRPKSHAQDLLRPWLGDAPLPDDLPLPIILHVQLHAGQTVSVEAIQAQFQTAGIRADIDTHAHWTKDLNRRARALQTLSLLILVLINSAILAACVFAIRAGITAQKQLMDVLHQIGTAPHYTARLFSTRFALSAFKAGCIGALGAFLLLFIISLFSGALSGSNYFLPGFAITLKDVYLSSVVPIFMALISGLAAWHTVMKSLITEMYR